MKGFISWVIRKTFCTLKAISLAKSKISIDHPCYLTLSAPLIAAKQWECCLSPRASEGKRQLESLIFTSVLELKVDAPTSASPLGLDLGYLFWFKKKIHFSFFIIPKLYLQFLCTFDLVKIWLIIDVPLLIINAFLIDSSPVYTDKFSRNVN